MNISGPFVARVWAEMIKQHNPASLSLVIVHDELEREFGQVKLVPWDRSHRGHNGIKSVKSLLSQKKYPESPFARIAVGIGRPKERDAATVSQYVLAPISPQTELDLEEKAALDVRRELQNLEDEWRMELAK
jgi:PTH1 family peptidyl-tRNA hydrolase